MASPSGIPATSKKDSFVTIETTSLSPDLLEPKARNSFRSLRIAFGFFGVLSIIGGTICTLAILGFLVFLWTGEGTNEGLMAVPSWRYIVLKPWVTEAITLSSVVIRFINGIQASLCTSFMAAMALERHGVPLSQLAEISLIRSNNDGPFRLCWLLLSSIRRSPIAQTLLMVVLVLGSIATQFTSTILVSDLSTSSLIGDAKNVSTGVSATQTTFEEFHNIMPFFLKPIWLPYGEIRDQYGIPSAAGVSDTGRVRRIHPLVQQGNRTHLRRYTGQGIIFNSRVVCVPPTIQGFKMSSVYVPDPHLNEVQYVPYFSGSLNYTSILGPRGVSLPEECPDGSCFPSAFNCSLGVRLAHSRESALSACVPSGRHAIWNSLNQTFSPNPIANNSEVFLFVRSNIYEGSYLQNITNMPPINATTRNEWTTYKFPYKLSLDVSLCFMQAQHERGTVDLFTPTDLSEGAVDWNSTSAYWDTPRVRKLYGTLRTANNTRQFSPTPRGLYTVQGISNVTQSSTTGYLGQIVLDRAYDSVSDSNVTLHLSPYSGGKGVFPHVEYMAFFTDELALLNRPAIAFQDLVTALSASVVDGLLGQFDVMQDLRLVFSESVLTPQSSSGLATVLVITSVNIMVAVIIVSMFLVRTNYTSQGNYWHAVSQIVSDVTQPIIHRATKATDDEVTDMLSGHDVKVKLERRGLSGRVEVVRCDDILI